MTLYRDLVGLLDEHKRLYQALDQLGESQSSLIETDDTDALLGILADRQAVIERLDHGNRRLAPARQDWDRLSPDIGPDERDHIRLLLNEVTELATRVAARDDRDRKLLESRRDEITDEIMSLTRSRKAFAAYGPAGGPVQARFQDREG